MRVTPLSLKAQASGDERGGVRERRGDTEGTRVLFQSSAEVNTKLELGDMSYPMVPYIQAKQGPRLPADCDVTDSSWI
jgi:hypothetical protein